MIRSLFEDFPPSIKQTHTHTHSHLMRQDALQQFHKIKKMPVFLWCMLEWQKKKQFRLCYYWFGWLNVLCPDSSWECVWMNFLCITQNRIKMLTHITSPSNQCIRKTKPSLWRFCDASVLTTNQVNIACTPFKKCDVCVLLYGRTKQPKQERKKKGNSYVLLAFNWI